MKISAIHLWNQHTVLWVDLLYTCTCFFFFSEFVINAYLYIFCIFSVFWCVLCIIFIFFMCIFYVLFCVYFLHYYSAVNCLSIFHVRTVCIFWKPVPWSGPTVSSVASVNGTSPLLNTQSITACFAYAVRVRSKFPASPEHGTRLSP